MGDFIKTQSSFANGEIAPEFYANDNVKGLSRLVNMDVTSGGGLSRRNGLRYVDSLRGAARLMPFSVADNEEYVIALTNYRLYIYQNGVKIQDIITAWPYEAIDKIQCANRFGTMIFVHPDYKPYVIKKENGIFKISDFAFFVNGADLTKKEPFVKFDDALGVTISLGPSDRGANYATFTTNKNFWNPAHVNSRLKLLDLQWEIVEYISPTQIVAYVNAVFQRPSDAVADWYEAAFSNYRGWPCSIAFHQDRLVFGGTHSWPGGIWMSCVGQHTNFDTGSGLDDEAIFVSLLSKERQQIHTIVSGDVLQVLTNSGEWTISGAPLSPTVIDIKQHTAFGAYMTKYLPPQKMENATVFVSGNGSDIRQLCQDEIGENYNANDLCVLSKHLIKQPVDMAYNKISRRLFIVLSGGNMAVLNHNSASGISAWGTYETDGLFLSVAVSDGKTYVVVQRENEYFLECFDASAMKDCVNHSFSFVASGLPLQVSGHNIRKLRLHKISARVFNTKSIFINQKHIKLPNEIYAENSSGFSGDVSVSVLGSIQDTFAPVWTIHSTDSLPATVLSVTFSGAYFI